jgi:hypothetical protein
MADLGALIRSLSDKELRFYRSGMDEKVDYIINNCEGVHSETPSETKDFNREGYTNYMEQPQSPKIKSVSFKFDDLEIISTRYDTEPLRDQDTHARDYGCYGRFSELRVSYKGKLAFVSATCCKCHAEGPNDNYRFEKDKNTSLRVSVLTKEMIKAVDAVYEQRKHELEVEGTRAKLEEFMGKEKITPDQLQEALVDAPRES